MDDGWMMDGGWMDDGWRMDNDRMEGSWNQWTPPHALRLPEHTM